MRGYVINLNECAERLGNYVELDQRGEVLEAAVE